MERIKWDEHKINLLKRHYAKGNLEDLAQRLGCSMSSIRRKAGELGLHRKIKNKPWTERQTNYMREHYADTDIEIVVKNTHHTLIQVYAKAKHLGLKKDIQSISETRQRNRLDFLKRETPEQKAARVAKQTQTIRNGVKSDRLRIRWGLEPKYNIVKYGWSEQERQQFKQQRLCRQ